MTKLESVVNSRVWKGAEVSEVTYNDRPGIKLSHPSGAVAFIYKFAGSIQARHWDAYQAALRAQMKLKVEPKFRAEEHRKTIAHFEKLSGMKIENLITAEATCQNIPA